MCFLDLGAPLRAELLGWQDVALLVERGTLEPSTALEEGTCVLCTSGEQDREACHWD